MLFSKSFVYHFKFYIKSIISPSTDIYGSKKGSKTLCCDKWHSYRINNYPKLLVFHLSSMFTNYALHSRSTLCPRKIAIFIELNNKDKKSCLFKNVILWHVKDINIYAFTKLSFDWRYRNNIDLIFISYQSI